MANKYRISLNVAGLTVSVNPVFDRLSIQEERPEGEAFLRPKLDTELTFHRGDFDYLLSLTIDQEIIIYVEQLQSDGSYEVKYTGVFTKTDCTWNEDDKTCKVKPRTRDDYEKILEGLNKELNLVDLTPPLTSVNYTKPAVLQIYISGGNYIQNYTEGNYWETPVPVPYFSANDQSNDLTNLYHFGYCGRVRFIPGSGNLNPDVSGVYDAAFISDNGAGRYQIRNSGSQWVIVDLDNGANVVYTAPVGEDAFNLEAFERGAVFTSTVDSDSKCYFLIELVYARLLTDKGTVNGSPTNDFPENDISGGANYDKVLPIQTTNFTPSDNYQSNPTPFGRFDDEALSFASEYFTIPSGVYWPLNKADWKDYSLWFYFDAALEAIVQEGGQLITLTDAYHLHDVINAFLGELNPTITHNNTAPYSDFFYSTSNPIRTNALIPLITPKSNILVGNYDQPAKKAPLRLGELLQFLKDFYGVYWFIRDGMLILEHIEYFERGGSYTTNQIGANLTTDLEPKTAKAWGYRTNQYTYEKTDMPERIEYNWMDPQSPVFEGHPIEMLDNRVDKGNVQGRNFAKFSADIDYISTAPDEITKTGFVWMETEQQGQGFFVPIAPITFEGLNLNIQNGYASLTFALDEYQKYQLPCTNIKINNEVTTAESVIKTKIQEVFFPMNPVEDNLSLVTTGIGSGKLKTREINLLNGIVKMTLKHDQ